MSRASGTMAVCPELKPRQGGSVGKGACTKSDDLSSVSRSHMVDEKN